MPRRPSNPAAVAGLLTLAAVVSLGAFVEPAAGGSLACPRQAELLGVNPKDDSSTWLTALTDAARSLQAGDHWQAHLAAALPANRTSPIAKPALVGPAASLRNAAPAPSGILAQRQLIDLPPPPAA